MEIEKRNVVETEDFDEVLSDYFEKLKSNDNVCPCRLCYIFSTPNSGQETLSERFPKWFAQHEKLDRFEVVDICLYAANSIILMGDLPDYFIRNVYRDCRIWDLAGGLPQSEHFVAQFREHCAQGSSLPENYFPPSVWLLKHRQGWRVWWFGNTPLDAPRLSATFPDTTHKGFASLPNQPQKTVHYSGKDSTLATPFEWIQYSEKKPPPYSMIASRIFVGKRSYVHESFQDESVYVVAQKVVQKILSIDPKINYVLDKWRVMWRATGSPSVIQFKFDQDIAELFCWWYMKQATIDCLQAKGIAIELSPKDIRFGKSTLLDLLGYAYYTKMPADE